ncbi:MAG: thiamine phosphate synthase [Burkholderiaceae bacterium]
MLMPFGLYVVTPDCDDDGWLAAAVAAAVRGGASSIQYRHKRAGAGQRLRQARRLAEVCRAQSVPLIVNDSPEVAREAAAHGVHLGREDGDPVAARRLLGDGLLIGVSCYDELERAQRWREVADYVAFGAVFSSSVKPAAVRAPLSLFEQARREGFGHAGSERAGSEDAGFRATGDTPRPALVAIGGITADNAAPLASAGIDAIAVISAVFGDGSGDPDRCEARARRVCAAFEGGLADPTGSGPARD